MDIFLYNKISSNISKIQKKIKKIQDGGYKCKTTDEILLEIPESQRTQELKETIDDVNNILCKSRNLYESEIEGFKPKYTDPLQTFNKNISNINDLINDIKLDFNHDQNQFEELKTNYNNYINDYKNFIIRNSEMNLDPNKILEQDNQGKYTYSVLYDTKNTIENFNEDIKKNFSLFSDNSNINNPKDFNQNIEINKLELENIRTKCNELEMLLDEKSKEYINIIKAFNTTDLNQTFAKTEVINSISEIFKSGNDAKAISEYDYNVLIKYHPLEGDIITNFDAYNGFLTFINSIKDNQHFLGINKIPSYNNNDIESILKYFTNQTENVYETLDLSQIIDIREKGFKQNGGYDDIYNYTIINDSTNITLLDLINEFEKTNIFIKKVSEKYNDVILKLERVTFYNFYLKVLAYKSWEKQDFIIYNYINKGLCQYYFNILEDILEKFKNIDLIKENEIIYNGIQYLNKYHYVIINKLYNFFKALLNLNIFTNNTIIKIDNELFNKNIKQIGGDIQIFLINMKENFILFNNFKEILDSYKETFQNRVTIYARINDKEKDPYKMFKKNKDSNRVLDIDTRKCILGKPAVTNQVNFNEVFDTELNTETISKYMTLASQITKGKGVIIMTYGYSGTGKTFTLFGNKEKQGILQSTLSNIIGVKKIFLRVFELYGKGTIYTDYWKDLKNIEQKIFHYNLEVIQFEETDTKTNKKIQSKKLNLIGNPIEKKVETTYFMNTSEYKKGDKTTYDGYLEISNNDDDTKNIFSNFAKFTDEIERKRGYYNEQSNNWEGGDYITIDEQTENIKRITSTPNNPQSSRSILFYEFYIQVENNIIPFVVIDLPGREEIVSTYCDAHLKDFREYIKTNKDNDKTIDKYINYKLYDALLSSYVINPVIFNVFHETISHSNQIKASMSPSKILEKINNISYDNIKFNKIIDNQDKKYTIIKDGKDETKKFKFSYKNNMFEGIYINENIMGLITILKEIIEETKKVTLSKPESQKQLDILQMTKYFLQIKLQQVTQSNDDKLVINKNLIYSKKKIDELYNYNSSKEIYDSQKIFLYNQKENNIILNDIIKKYNKDKEFTLFDPDKPDGKETIIIKKVDSYKVFYLLTNDESQKKCSHQYELLENTLSLINAIRN
jgi:hypothetical protein